MTAHQKWKCFFKFRMTIQFGHLSDYHLCLVALWMMGIVLFVCLTDKVSQGIWSLLQPQRIVYGECKGNCCVVFGFYYMNTSTAVQPDTSSLSSWNYVTDLSFYRSSLWHKCGVRQICVHINRGAWPSPGSTRKKIHKKTFSTTTNEAERVNRLRNPLRILLRLGQKCSFSFCVPSKQANNK